MMTWRQFLGWSAVAFIAWWIISQPESAAHAVHGIGTLLSRTAAGVSKFLTSI